MARHVIEAELLTAGKGFVNHGSDPDVERPAEFVSVEWYGSVPPNNAIEGDTWLDTS